MSYRGASIGQDARFSNQDAKRRRKIRATAPRVYRKASQVDLAKCAMSFVAIWYKRRLEEMLSFSDDILEGMIGALLDSKTHKSPNPVVMEAQLEGFLADKTRQFVEELMTVLLEASENPSGIPVSVMAASGGSIVGTSAGEPSQDQAAIVLEAVERLRQQGIAPPPSGAAAASGGRRKRRFGAEPQAAAGTVAVPLGGAAAAGGPSLPALPAAGSAVGTAGIATALGLSSSGQQAVVSELPPPAASSVAVADAQVAVGAAVSAGAACSGPGTASPAGVIVNSAEVSSSGTQSGAGGEAQSGEGEEQDGEGKEEEEPEDLFGRERRGGGRRRESGGTGGAATGRKRGRSASASRSRSRSRSRSPSPAPARGSRNWRRDGYSDGSRGRKRSRWE